MLIRNIAYFFKEAMRSIVRNGWMSFASVAVVTVTLLILGSFMLLNINVEQITQEIKDQVEIVVYLDEELAGSEVEQLRVAVIQLPQVEEVRYVSKEQALARLQSQLGELVAGYEEEGRNPLRDSFEIRTKIPEDIPAVAQTLQTLPGIARVDYGTDVVEKLFRFTGAVRWVGLAFMGGLAFTALFLIANTIKLTVNARAKEIMIMKWVGATEWFIRWPFVIEGVLLGGIGALLPALALFYLYHEVVAWTKVNLFFLPLVPPQMVLVSITKLLLLIGITIGGLGSLLSMRRFLKV
ncbi:MAG TPA: ABC transporter permease [Firmicutes bacterium]|jgi:cell division transport system permease protein|nr:ABC transporter permease [Bacillota bacterium]HAA37726.1 ABC transporter permease [Bacillota bacterium]